jgi:F0F1-type ATP synthase membrane subunit c/vacuolar-type H+-ATPase subunit K
MDRNDEMSLGLFFFLLLFSIRTTSAAPGAGIGQGRRGGEQTTDLADTSHARVHGEGRGRDIVIAVVMSTYGVLVLVLVLIRTLSALGAFRS